MGEPRPARHRARARVRLAALAALVLCAAGAAALLLPHSPDGLAGALGGGGAVAVAVVLAAWIALTPMMVSGTLLAMAAGLLLGPGLGAAVSVAGATLGGLAAFGVAVLGGGDAARTLAGPRLTRAAEALRRNGFGAIVLARLLPGVPATVLHYAAGLARMRVRTFAIAIAIGGAPRTVAYAALGGTHGDLLSPAGLVAGGLLAALGAGAAAAAVVRLLRRRARMQA